MYDLEIRDCHRRIAVGKALNTLLNFNPDFKTVILEGYLRENLLKHSLNINADKSGSIHALKAAAAFKTYLDWVLADAEQARIDLDSYQQLLQDGR